MNSVPININKRHKKAIKNQKNHRDIKHKMLKMAK